MDTEYNFTDRERLYFDRLQQQFNSGVMSGIQMIVTQQDLPGQWRIKKDGSGIERVEMIQDSNPDFKELVRKAVSESERTKKTNGVA